MYIHIATYNKQLCEELASSIATNDADLKAAQTIRDKEVAALIIIVIILVVIILLWLLLLLLSLL